MPSAALLPVTPTLPTTPAGVVVDGSRQRLTTPLPGADRATF
jgi:hypothetical protein